ncbi:cytochrome P450 [Pseudonocardia kunmingensis]|uniref:Pentalenic acid synthase n=1 Tax=Pseudonocardia kunmingensis TaxID=630975 RepID=A0A543DKV9_9PSEU|nr:cytochrome P450 [Pseudonocardia kunmingensis]TQM09974.1 pentalenic acid synthase [Pseudonocardia kunmingensis]
MSRITTPDHRNFPIPRQCPFAPPLEYDRLRAAEPVSRVQLPTGGTAWLVTRYDDVRTVLSSPVFSADGTRPGFPALVPGAAQILQRPPFIRMDPPQHSFYRRMLIQDFTAKRIKTMRPGIQATVDRLLDDLLTRTPPVDLVDAFALPLSSLVICQLLGVPYDDHEFFQGRSKITVSGASTAEQFAAALGELRAYMDGLITRKQQGPGDDLMSKLVAEQLEPAGELRRDELLMMCLMLLNAGHETTANMISLGTVALLEHPDQLAALRSDPELLPGAVEELLRYLSIADLVTTRIAAEDTELSGTPIRVGEGVIALLAAADWDPAVFPEPERFDVRRGSRHHVGFGYGVHQCLGQNLARLELEIAFSSLFARIPTLQVAAPVDELPYKHGGIVYGVHELPVTW